MSSCSLGSAQALFKLDFIGLFPRFCVSCYGFKKKKKKPDYLQFNRGRLSKLES